MSRSKPIIKTINANGPVLRLSSATEYTTEMDTLPPELLELIVDHCDHASQKTLRSLNHTIHDLATPAVFSTFYIAPCIFSSALQNLNNLIHCPRKLARHITQLTFHTDILPFWDCYKFQAHASKHSTDPSARDTAWNTFVNLQKREEDWTLYQERYALQLKEAVSSLPNVTSASAGVAVPFQGSTARWPLWKRLKKDMLISPDDWLYDAEADYSESKHRTAQTTCATLTLLEALGFRACFAGIAQLRDLRLHMVHDGRLKPLMAGYMTANSDSGIPRTFSPDIEARFQTLLGAFTHLTTLDLQSPHPESAASRGLSHTERNALRALAGAEVCTILSQATNLRTLRFAYASEAATTLWEPEEEALHPLFPLFAPASGEPPWPKLQHLDLSVNLPHTLLLSFLALLSPALRTLELRDMCVYDAQALFAGLPQAVKLESIYIECLWTKTNARCVNSGVEPKKCILCEGSDVDAPYERKLKAYLLGQAEDFPRLTEEDGEES